MRSKSGTRRSLGAAVIALTAVLAAGCGGGGSETAGGTGRQESVIRFAITAMPSQLDPIATKNEVADVTYLNALYDGLTGVDAAGKIVPRLAERYERSDDGLSWTFTIRGGAVFHDGTPIDAEAVAANLERALDAAETSGVLKAKLAKVDSVETPDSRTVVIKLSEPDPSLPASLAGPALGIASPAAFGTLGTDPVGSGPYAFVSLKSDRVVYKRFEKYWDPGVAKVDNLEVLSIADGSARMNALRSGQIDAASAQLNLNADIKAFREDSRFTVVETPTQSVVTLYLNTTRPPLDKPEVRRALNYAVNSAEISKSLLGGLCTPTNQPFPSGSGHVPALEGVYTYDPAKARQLLQSAGAEGLKLKGIFLAAGVSGTIAPAVQAQMAEAGITLELKGVNPADARPLFRAGDLDMMIHQINAEVDPALVLRNNFLGLDSPGGVPEEIEESADEAIGLPLDSPERTAALEEFSKKIVETPTHVHLCAVPNFFVGSSRVTGLDQMPWGGITLNPDVRVLGLTDK